MPGPLESSAAAVIADALGRARAEGISRIGEEHLFAALLTNPYSRPVLASVGGPDEAEAVWADVRAARRRGGVTAAEQQALASFGIDLDDVVARLEAQLGAGVLDDPEPSPTRRQRASMTRQAVAVLNTADRLKAARGDRRMTAQHLALGLLATPGLFADALRARGITLAGALEAAGDDDAPQAAG